jgi:glycosyltransferase involved in cell wall biosynthesis
VDAGLYRSRGRCPVADPHWPGAYPRLPTVPPMRIAHVTDFYLPRLGGIEMHVHDLAARQRAAGHEVEILTSTPAGPTPAGPTPAGQANVPVLRVTEAFRRPAALHPGAPRLAGELLRPGRYDAVHVHAGVLSPLAFASVAAAVRAGLPVVVTLHSFLTRWEQAFRALDAAVGFSAWPVQWSAVSDVAAAPVRRLVGRPVLVLPNGIDPADWTLRPAPRRPDQVLVVGVMRLAPRKRPLPLLRMLRRVRRLLPASVDLRAVIVGEGRQRPTLERFLWQFRMADWVQLPGRLSRAEIRQVFRRADLFVAPAVLESFGIAALEARCSGLPVVGRTGSGLASFVEDGRDGLLVSSDAAMTRSLARLAADPAERARLAAHCHRAPSGVDWHSVLRRTAAAYDSAAAMIPPVAANSGLGPVGAAG